MSSVWTSDDITFCTSDCNDMKCERNSKHIHHREIPHSYADLDGDKRFCRKVQNDEKEYQPGVWYDADVEVPYLKAYTGSEFFVCVFDKLLNKEHYDVARYEHRENVWPDTWRCRSFDDMRFYVKSWMIIPEPPKE